MIFRELFFSLQAKRLSLVKKSSLVVPIHYPLISISRKVIFRCNAQQDAESEKKIGNSTLTIEKEPIYYRAK